MQVTLPPAAKLGREGGVMPFLAMLLVTHVALAACGGLSGGDGSATVRDTLPSGVVRVTNTLPADAPPMWRLVEELRVGAVDGDGPDVFGELEALAPLPGGGFAVIEAQAQEVRVFGPGGEHVATHGRKGGGPGEFENAIDLMLGPQERLWVADPGNVRMSVLDPVAGFVESFPLPFPLWGFAWDGAMTADGRILEFSFDRGQSREILRVYDLTMTQVDSISLKEVEVFEPEDDPGIFVQDLGGGSQYMRGVPFHPSGLRYLDAQGAIWSKPRGDPDYVIRKWLPGGDTTLILETRRPAVPVTTAERDSVIARIRESFRRSGATAELDWSRIPAVKSAVEDVFVSAEGDVWVRTPSPVAETTFDVYAPDGSYVGTAVGAARLTHPVVRGNAFWAFVSDDFNVPYVIRARITPTR
ncbi:hypothetical protein [Candidatus Palauibacter sp.]|uniref:hypothetical protein n=1 Tax=Candidatus Palauibacter sp. TaxID=3101350 RepID=UPI003B028F94